MIILMSRTNNHLNNSYFDVMERIIKWSVNAVTQNKIFLKVEA